jgi:hypothetical protein
LPTGIFNLSLEALEASGDLEEFKDLMMEAMKEAISQYHPGKDALCKEGMLQMEYVVSTKGKPDDF